MYVCMWSNVFLGVIYGIILIGWGPSVPKFFGTSYMRGNSMKNNNQITCEENFYKVESTTNADT